MSSGEGAKEKTQLDTPLIKSILRGCLAGAVLFFIAGFLLMYATGVDIVKNCPLLIFFTGVGAMLIGVSTWRENDKFNPWRDDGQR